MAEHITLTPLQVAGNLQSCVFGNQRKLGSSIEVKAVPSINDIRPRDLRDMDYRSNRRKRCSPILV